MNLVGIIPAHLASVRFPRKILYKFKGIPMIEHVRRRALQSKLLSKVIVATCDKEIAEVIEQFGGEVILTSSKHKSGTSRIAEAASNIDCSHAMLIQGDEPLLLSKHIDKIAKNIKSAIIVPGSGLVKEKAENEGLDKIFTKSGFEWRSPGCSMCLGMNDDKLSEYERCASTSNRNFEGRQGRLGRTHLVSPATAAAAALYGHFVDVRDI